MSATMSQNWFKVMLQCWSNTMEATEKEWIDAIGLRLLEMLESCPEIDRDSAELIVASVQLGILGSDGLFRQWKSGNSIIESSYFEDSHRDATSSRKYKVTRIR
jgi:hypothetical protein